jgi:hypothetical protein
VSPAKLSAVILLMTLSVPVVVEATEMSADHAYRQIRETGSLLGDDGEKLVVKGRFDFGQLQASDAEVVIRHVRFASPVSATKIDMQRPLLIEDSEISYFNASGSKWGKTLTVRGSKISHLFLNGSIFEDRVQVQNTDFEKADLSHAIFDLPLEFLGGEIGTLRCSRTEFKGAAAFDNLKILKRASFISAVFRSKVSFVEPFQTLMQLLFFAA